MILPYRLTYFPLILLLSASFLAHAWCQETPARLVVFLVRHAEKVDKSADAALSKDGQERAQALAAVLRDSNIKHVHSSDFKRTRDTAAPIATLLAKSIDLYDPTKLSALASKLKAMGGRHLVVGHSNTTPALVKLLGGRPGAQIDENSEFDRLYILSSDTRGSVDTLLLRYNGKKH
ncbi:histidine phosphatase family protein [bacterium]|jgi:phosphohistidine phosphatase SixA|nr:histidine phosphatase family protein [bacterium]MDB4746142.1 histidine phosphatase family protein [Verrucomicrobiota bacterium]